MQGFIGINLSQTQSLAALNLAKTNMANFCKMARLISWLFMTASLLLFVKVVALFIKFLWIDLTKARIKIAFGTKMVCWKTGMKMLQLLIVTEFFAQMIFLEAISKVLKISLTIWKIWALLCFIFLQFSSQVQTIGMTLAIICALTNCLAVKILFPDWLQVQNKRALA